MDSIRLWKFCSTAILVLRIVTLRLTNECAKPDIDNHRRRRYLAGFCREKKCDNVHLHMAATKPSPQWASTLSKTHIWFNQLSLKCLGEGGWHALFILKRKAPSSIYNHWSNADPVILSESYMPAKFPKPSDPRFANILPAAIHPNSHQYPLSMELTIKIFSFSWLFRNDNNCNQWRTRSPRCLVFGYGSERKWPAPEIDFFSKTLSGM